MDREPLSASTWIVLICGIAIVVLILTGCADPYQDCIDQQRTEYQQRNPRVSYSELLARQRDFDIMCERFR